MPTNDDEKALALIEASVYKAQALLAQNQSFRPFLMLLNEAGEEEFYANEREDEDESYALLENTLEERLKKSDIEVLVLVKEAGVPSHFKSTISQSIRVHLEERSQQDKKLSGRFLYVPYEYIPNEKPQANIRLHAPLAVGFPLQYLRN